MVIFGKNPIFLCLLLSYTDKINVNLRFSNSKSVNFMLKSVRNVKLLRKIAIKRQIVNNSAEIFPFSRFFFTKSPAQ